jgi:hypothetical protein
MARPDAARPGLAGKASRDLAWPGNGQARQGRRGEVWRGMARPGQARHGEAGHGRHG